MKRFAGRAHRVGGHLAWLVMLVAVAAVLVDACAGGHEAPEVPPTQVAVKSGPPVEKSLDERPRDAHTDVPSPAPVVPERILPTPSVPSPTAPRLSLPSTLKVGLGTDLTVLEISCCVAVAELGGAGESGFGPVTVRPAPAAVDLPVYRLQVAALHDEGQARGLAGTLASRFAVPADSVFDAGTGLYRVRLGRYDAREAAEEARRRFEVRGLTDAWVISVPGRLTAPALQVTVGGVERVVTGRWVTLRARDDVGIEALGRRYRGRILVYLNDRASLNLINELSVEQYLRGVVPREMGPNLYGNLAALKAQTVAARTYTLGNMGEFAAEGYDICATPRCQVYGGMNDEHPLSDRAVRETAGEVLVYGGELVDALYTSTCGGHTEDVSVVFPTKHEPYLKGVPCVEAGIDWVTGAAAQGTVFPGDLMTRLVPPPSDGSAAERLAARLRSLARRAGLPLADDRLTSLDRREVQRFLASTFDLALDVRLFSSSMQVAEWVDQPPADWTAADLELAAYLVRSGLLSDRLKAPVTAEEQERIVLQMALFLHVLESREVRYQSRSGAALYVRGEDGVETLHLSAEVETFRSRNGEISARTLDLAAGDRLVVFFAAGRPVAIVHQATAVDAAFEHFRRKSAWTRSRTDAQLAALVRQRYPGLRFRGLEILSRGVSGRVGKMRLLGAEGKTVDVEGLAIRWTLDLPDTWFNVKRLRPPGQEPKWLFSGRGWGHGVGLCQVGAYGMGLRGHDYHEILEHYYSGVAVVDLAPPPAAMAAGR